MSKTYQILVVDDHPVVRRGLVAMIQDETDLKVCGEAADVSEAVRKARQLDPDLAVIDMSLETGHGLELIKQLRSHESKLLILVASVHDENLFAERALRAGAQGYISKQAPADKFIEAIRHVLNGNIYLSLAMTNRLLQQNAADGNQRKKSVIDLLSDRELSVFQMIGQGLTTREISKRLHLSIKTIETYREHIKYKLDLANATELTRSAVQWTIENAK